MKKVLIILSILLTISILGIWLYLFVYGSPTSTSGIFARFGIENDTQVPQVIIEPEGGTVDVGEEGDGKKERLTQLTMRPVAGAQFVDTGIFYAEQGTGHIYHINLVDGTETLLSGTTIQGARYALFSQTGTHVAISTLIEGVRETIVGSLDAVSGTIAGVSLPSGARGLTFYGTSTLFYFLKNQSGSIGYSYDIETGVGKEIFSIPLRDIQVLWGEKIYIYTTPTSFQKGNLYLLRGNQLTYTYPSAFGLTAFTTPFGLITTYISNGAVQSTFYGENTQFSTEYPLLPEKCVGGNTNNMIIYCGVPSTVESETFPDAWYQGTLTYQDSLWIFNARTGSIDLFSDFTYESGRYIDIAHMGIDGENKHLYFINKNDNTLWMYTLVQ